jgi:nucleotide-binding universal stress UspA family protein
MFRKILLPVDQSNKHGPAIKVAVELAGQNGEVVLLHVIETILGLTMEEEKDFYRRLEKAARAHLQHLGGDIEQHKVAWRAEVLFGNRGPEVLHYAATMGVDLIVVTSPRLNPSNPAESWGSLSYKLGLMAACPVLLVK